MKKFLLVTTTLLLSYLPFTEAATNSGKNYRYGSVKSRTQTRTNSGNYVKRNSANGRFMDQKTSSKSPFKGITKE